MNARQRKILQVGLVAMVATVTYCSRRDTQRSDFRLEAYYAMHQRDCAALTSLATDTRLPDSVRPVVERLPALCDYYDTVFSYYSFETHAALVPRALAYTEDVVRAMVELTRGDTARFPGVHPDWAADLHRRATEAVPSIIARSSAAACEREFPTALTVRLPAPSPTELSALIPAPSPTSPPPRVDFGDLSGDDWPPEDLVARRLGEPLFALCRTEIQAMPWYRCGPYYRLGSVVVVRRRHRLRVVEVRSGGVAAETTIWDVRAACPRFLSAADDTIPAGFNLGATLSWVRGVLARVPRGGAAGPRSVVEGGPSR